MRMTLLRLMERGGLAIDSVLRPCRLVLSERPDLGDDAGRASSSRLSPGPRGETIGVLADLTFAFAASTLSLLRLCGYRGHARASYATSSAILSGHSAMVVS
jgi:hypothetical protein